MRKQLKKEAIDLQNRLRGIYTIPVNYGAGSLTRTFPVPPINEFAADLIARQDAYIDGLGGNR